MGLALPLGLDFHHRQHHLRPADAHVRDSVVPFSNQHVRYGQVIGTGAGTSFNDDEGNHTPDIVTSEKREGTDMRQRTRRIATAGISAVLALTMVPMQAFAATSVTVDKEYTSEANGTGANGGTWSWDGADGMALDGYNGGSITAKGDLDITLSGDNTITASAGKPSYGSAIYVDDGDLSITGDGTLDAESSTATYGVIEAEDGDVDIENTTVTVNATSNGGSYGITSFGGNVNITGSDVDITCDKTGDEDGWNIGILSNANGEKNGGQVNITSSDVSVTCTGDAFLNPGIMADNETSSDPASSVNIVDSNVNVSAPGGAIIAAGYDSTCKKGTINVTGSTVTSPEGAAILDLQGDGAYENGQVIGTGTGTLTYLYLYDTDGSANPAIATSVAVEKPTTLDPAPVPAAAATLMRTAANAEMPPSLPKTGDDALPATLAFCSLFAAAGALLLARKERARG